MNAFVDPCRVCGQTIFPHTCLSMSIYNARYYCPDGKKHTWRQRRWLRAVCVDCGERAHGKSSSVHPNDAEEGA